MSPSPIDPVIARMEAIAAGLSEADGVARFNELYLAVTRAVGRAMGATAFEDVAFLARLDVVFADLYFQAVDADAAGRRPAHSWRPLFDRRARPRIAPIQFALAGMNAHINHDLAIALVSVCGERGVRPRRDTPQHRDYVRVNAILEQVEEEVKARYDTGLVGVADEALGRLDDVLAMWSVARARAAAWSHAETLWALRDAPALAEPFVMTLDRVVGFAGRGMLVATL